jgi:RHS repeat-associated protein
VASVTANYAQDTNTVTLGLPGMFPMPLEGSAANWHRFFLGLPSNYMSPDPAMRWQTLLTGDSYTYANGNPVTYTDPTGLDVSWAQRNPANPYGNPCPSNQTAMPPNQAVIPRVGAGGQVYRQMTEDEAYYYAHKINEIVDHAFEDKVQIEQQFPEAVTKTDFVNVIVETIQNPSTMTKALSDGGQAWFDPADGTLVIVRPGPGSTIMRPDTGLDYYLTKVY